MAGGVPTQAIRQLTTAGSAEEMNSRPPTVVTRPDIWLPESQAAAAGPTPSADCQISKAFAKVDESGYAEAFRGEAGDVGKQTATHGVKRERHALEIARIGFARSARRGR